MGFIQLTCLEGAIRSQMFNGMSLVEWSPAARQAYILSDPASYNRNAGVHLARPLLDHQVLVCDTYHPETVIPNNSTGSLGILHSLRVPAGLNNKRQSEGATTSFHKLAHTPAGKNMLAKH